MSEVVTSTLRSYEAYSCVSVRWTTSWRLRRELCVGRGREVPRRMILSVVRGAKEDWLTYRTEVACVQVVTVVVVGGESVMSER